MSTSQKIINNVIGKKRHGGKNDYDGDGITNKKDCQPRNTMRQHHGAYPAIWLGDMDDPGLEMGRIKDKRRYRIVSGGH